VPEFSTSTKKKKMGEGERMAYIRLTMQLWQEEDSHLFDPSGYLLRRVHRLNTRRKIWGGWRLQGKTRAPILDKGGGWSARTCEEAHVGLIVEHVPEADKNTSLFFPGEHSQVHQNHQLATSRKYPPGSQIPDICPMRGVCGKANNPGTN
jgi:hypothetical protein